MRGGGLALLSRAAERWVSLRSTQPYESGSRVAAQDVSFAMVVGRIA